MDITDVTHTEGQDNLGGIQTPFQMISWDSIWVFPKLPGAPTDDTTLVTIINDLVLAPGKFPSSIYITPETTDLKEAKQGSRDAMSYKRTFDFEIPGGNDDVDALVRKTANRNLVIIFTEMDGTKRIMGLNGIPAMIESFTGAHGPKTANGQTNKFSAMDFGWGKPPKVAGRIITPVQAAKTLTVLQTLRPDDPAQQAYRFIILSDNVNDGDSFSVVFPASGAGAGETLVITFKNSPSASTDCQIGATIIDTTTNLETLISSMDAYIEAFVLKGGNNRGNGQIYVKANAGGFYDGMIGNSVQLNYVNSNDSSQNQSVNLTGGIDATTGTFDTITFNDGENPPTIFKITNYCNVPTDIQFNSDQNVQASFIDLIIKGVLGPNKVNAEVQSGGIVTFTAGRKYIGSAGNALQITTTDDTYIASSGNFSGGTEIVD